MEPAEVFPVGVHLSEELAERRKGVMWLVRRCPCLTKKRADSILAGTSTPLALREIEEIASVLGVNPALLANLDRSWHQKKDGK